MLVLISSLGFAQQKIKILKYASGTSSAPTVYFDRTYTASQVDTTEWIDFSNADSTHFYFSSSDSTSLQFGILYGDGVKSSPVGTSLDTICVKSTAGAFKTFHWATLCAAAGSYPLMGRLVITFRSYHNDTQGTAKYSVYIRKFKK